MKLSEDIKSGAYAAEMQCGFDEEKKSKKGA